MKNKFKIIFLSLLIGFFLTPSLTWADVCSPSAAGGSTSYTGTGVQLCNPLENVSGNSFQGFLVHVLQVFAGLAGMVTIAYVMYSGLRFIISQGNSEAVGSAKRSLLWSLIGLVVMLFSYVLIVAIRTLLGAQNISSDATTSNPTPTNPLANISDFNGLYATLINGFFGVVGILAILMIVVSGFRYITAQGNQEQTEQARQGLVFAVLGLVVSLLAYVIVRATATFVGAH